MKVFIGVVMAMVFAVCWLTFAFTCGPVKAIQAHNAALAAVLTR